MDGRTLDFGERVVGLSPGYIRTDGSLWREPGADGPDLEALRREVPGSRIALPQYVADLVVYLCLAKARAVSGVVVDCEQGNLRSGPTRPKAGRSLSTIEQRAGTDRGTMRWLRLRSPAGPHTYPKGYLA